MSDDDVFEPRLGRSKPKRGKSLARYAGRVLVAAGLDLAGSASRARRFDGSRLGRGASLGRLLSSRDRLSSYRARRAVVKTRLVRLGGTRIEAARAHLRYIQRDGVTREGEPGTLYGATTDRADGHAFLGRCAGDRHQFRLIVSAEDADQYEELKPFVRRLMRQVEADLGTRLDWVAVDHFNTAHPHTHIALRGVDDRGANLIIARDYIAHGLRERAAELVTLDLGPRSTREIEARLRHDITQERLTAMDRRLLARMDAGRLVAAHAKDPFFHALEAGRLQVLGGMALAEPAERGQWRLAADLEDTLRRMGERGDIVRLMQREMTRLRLVREQRIYTGEPAPLVGAVVMRGLSDEHRDRHYLLVDGADGFGHYVDIGAGDAVEAMPEGAVVRVTPRSPAIREADRRIAAIAAANCGRYDVDLHLIYDPSATEAFAQTHIRRLEAMRRAGAGVAREPDGSWRIAPDHLAEVERYEHRQQRDRPVTVTLLSARPLDQLPALDGATWLDRMLAGGETVPARDSGFGRALCGALDTRRRWLVEAGLATGSGAEFRMTPGAVATLERRELRSVAVGLGAELGKPFTEARPGVSVEGRLVRALDLASGRFALVENSREFSLVPWQPLLAQRVGRPVAGIVGTIGISWRFGRVRGGPQLS